MDTKEYFEDFKEDKKIEIKKTTMLEARLVAGNLFKKLGESMKDLIRQGTWDCGEKGIQLQAMDSAHVCLVSVLLEADGFDRYRCDRDISLGVDMESMSKVLRCAAKDDIIEISAKGDTPDNLKFTFEAPDQERISEYEMKLMNIEQEHLQIPDTDYSVTVKMPSLELQRIIRDLSQFGDTITISAIKNSVQFSSDGGLGTGNIKLKQTSTQDEEKCVSIEISEVVEQQFACRYLNLFTKAAALSSQVKIFLSAEVPLMMEFSVGKIGHLRFYLAPKIEDE